MLYLLQTIGQSRDSEKHKHERNINKMKKLTASLLLISLLASLASCGQQDGGTPTTTPSDASSDTTAEETTSQFVPDDLPSDLDLGGKTVGIMIGDYFNAFLDDLYSPEETGNRLSDAVYRTSKKVQERLNVVLEYNYQTYAWSEMAGFQSKVISGILAGDTGFDLLFDVQNYSAQMLEGEYFANFADIGNISLEKPWYNQTVLENMPDDYIYFLSGQFSLANVKSAFAMYYNADLYSSLGLTEDLYALVDDGKWTIDKLDELTKNTYSDLNGDTKADASDRYGITFGDVNKYMGFIKSCGIDIFKKTSSGYEFTYDNEHASEVVSRLCALISDNENTQVAFGNDDTHPEYQISTGGGNYASKIFTDGRALFSFGLIADAATIVPSIDFSYGLLPYPKWDENQAEYTTMLQRTCYAMMPVTVEDKDAAGAVLEALSSESYRTLVPEYCEVSLKTRYSQDDDVSRMFDLVINSIVYDPGEIFASLLGTPSGAIKGAIIDNKPNWASNMAKEKTALIEKMNQITEK